jgi:hypothetical protein
MALPAALRPDKTRGRQLDRGIRSRRRAGLRRRLSAQRHNQKRRQDAQPNPGRKPQKPAVWQTRRDTHTPRNAQTRSLTPARSEQQRSANLRGPLRLCVKKPEPEIQSNPPEHCPQCRQASITNTDLPAILILADGAPTCSRLNAFAHQQTPVLAGVQSRLQVGAPSKRELLLTSSPGPVRYFIIHHSSFCIRPGVNWEMPENRL